MRSSTVREIFAFIMQNPVQQHSDYFAIVTWLFSPKIIANIVSLMRPRSPLHFPQCIFTGIDDASSVLTQARVTYSPDQLSLSSPRHNWPIAGQRGDHRSAHHSAHCAAIGQPRRGLDLRDSIGQVNSCKLAGRARERRYMMMSTRQWSFRSGKRKAILTHRFLDINGNGPVGLYK